MIKNIHTLPFFEFHEKYTIYSPCFPLQKRVYKTVFFENLHKSQVVSFVIYIYKIGYIILLHFD